MVINSFSDLQEYFRYSPDRDIIISGHRGGMMPGYPENCVESCEKTLSMMPTFFEVDFSFTKDSVMVLMHDLTVDRTTNGKGKVEDYTFEEIQRLNLVDREETGLCTTTSCSASVLWTRLFTIGTTMSVT